MLYSTTWIQYELNTDSTFSDKIIDSIRIYPNKTWNNYYRLKKDSVGNDVLQYLVGGKWKFGSIGRAESSDTNVDYIFLLMRDNSHPKNPYWEYVLVDGYRLKGTKRGKNCGNIDGPFLMDSAPGSRWIKKYIWQPKKKPKKTK